MFRLLAMHGGKDKLTNNFTFLSCRHNRAKCGSVCVANHTTPIDIVMLAVDNCFTLVWYDHLIMVLFE